MALKVRLFGGKPVMVGKQVAIADECCDGCGGGSEGACCVPDGQGCTSDISCEDCEGGGGTCYSTCEPDPCRGACCGLIDLTCTGNVSREECESGGGVYLLNESDCGDFDCTCCPGLVGFNSIIFSGFITGCSNGTVTLPTKTWARVVAGPGCDLNLYEWSVGSECGCAFQAQNCFPFVETDSISIDSTGDCDDPDYGNCLLLAEIFCNTGVGAPYALLAGNSGLPCCEGGGGIDTTFHGPYDLSNGLSVSYGSDTNPAIIFNYNISIL